MYKGFYEGIVRIGFEIDPNDKKLRKFSDPIKAIQNGEVPVEITIGGSINIGKLVSISISRTEAGLTVVSGKDGERV